MKHVWMDHNSDSVVNFWSDCCWLKYFDYIFLAERITMSDAKFAIMVGTVFMFIYDSLVTIVVTISVQNGIRLQLGVVTFLTVG